MKILTLALTGLLLAGCASPEVSAPSPTATKPVPTRTETAPPTVELVETPENASTQEPTQQPAQEPSSIPVAALELTTPQQEGPYYPITDPLERDNDLTVLAGVEGPADGQRLLLQGRVLQPDGTPLEGATVEIWQTDSQGTYMHPQDPNYGQRDLSFQFYGESLTDGDGVYQFTTIRPGLYGGRPEHIHFKVKMAGREILTSQFYFADDPRVAGQRIADALVLKPNPASNTASNSILVANKDIVVASE